MLGNKRGIKQNTYVPDYVVFDFETTGINPNRDAIIEISAVKVKSGEIMAVFSSLVNPQMPIPYGATQVNGITNEMVANIPLI